MIGRCLLPTVALSLLAASAQDGRRHFAVASIKPNRSGLTRLQDFAYSPGGRFTATNATLVDMIVAVYPTRRIQMQGGPAWIDSDRFDVFAKSDPDEGEVKPEQWPQMVQTLLEDRFNLRFHTETREAQVLALVLGKMVPKLDAPRPDEKMAFLRGDRGQIGFQNMPIAGLVNTVSNILHTPVIDRTGLTGSFDFKIDANQPGDAPAGTDTYADRVVAALRDQLGFHLEKQRAPLGFTIIDHAEKPTAN